MPCTIIFSSSHLFSRWSYFLFLSSSTLEVASVVEYTVYYTATWFTPPRDILQPQLFWYPSYHSISLPPTDLTWIPFPTVAPVDARIKTTTKKTFKTREFIQWGRHSECDHLLRQLLSLAESSVVPHLYPGANFAHVALFTIPRFALGLTGRNLNLIVGMLVVRPEPT